MTSLRLMAVPAIVSSGMLTAQAIAPAAATEYPTPPIAGNARYVTEFGAVCDGNTDDRAALQKALNAVRNGGQLVFPRDQTCSIRGHLKLNNGKNWTIIGQNATIQMHPSVSGIGKRPPNWILSTLNNRNFGIFDTNFDGRSDDREMPPPRTGPQNSAHNLKIWKGRNFKIVRSRFINSAQDGLLIGGKGPKGINRADASRNGVIYDVVADNNWRVGLLIINAVRITIENSVFSNTSGAWPQTGIQIEGNPGTYVPAARNIKIRNSMMYGNDGYGVQVVNVGMPRGIVVEGNYLSDNARGGVGANGKNITIRNNLFSDFNRGVSERYVSRLGNVTVKETLGVVNFLGKAQGNSLTNNTFEDIGVGKALLYVAAHSGNGHRFVGNCLHRVDVDELYDPRGRVGAVNNEVRGGGCPDARN